MSNLPSFEGLVKGLGVGLCVVTEDLRVTYANPRMAELAGKSLEDVVGKPLRETLSFADGSTQPALGTHGACLRPVDGGAVQVAVVAQPCAEGTSLLVMPFGELEALRWGTTQDRLNRVEQLLDRVERIHGSSIPPSGDRDLSSSPLLAQLSRREREIVTALVAARPVKQIAASLNISPHTVRNHLKSSFRKLNVGSQVELVAKLTQGPAMVAQASNGN